MGMTTITLEYAKPHIDEAASEEYTPIFANKGTGAFPRTAWPKLPCADASLDMQAPHRLSPGPPMPSPARPRTGRVYAGLHAGLNRKHAEKIAARTITYEIAEAGIEQAKATWKRP